MMLTHTRYERTRAGGDTHKACIYAHVEPCCCRKKSARQIHISMHVHTHSDTHQARKKKKEKRKNSAIPSRKAVCKLFVCLTQLRGGGRAGFTAGEPLVNQRKTTPR